jgi:hypothetical protein
MDQIYQPLPSPQAIRLLRILPVPPECEAVWSRVQVVSLSENPEYAALSYVWGDATQTESINVNRCPTDVTLNLAKVLRSSCALEKLLG